jgi:hypothetical protein
MNIKETLEILALVLVMFFVLRFFMKALAKEEDNDIS